MGVIEETYTKQLANTDLPAEAEATFKPGKVDLARLTLKLEQPKDTLCLGLQRMEISTQLYFPQAARLFGALNQELCQGEAFTITEEAFLTEKLEELGFELIQPRGYRETPSRFLVSPGLAAYLFENEFKIEKPLFYRGEPLTMQTSTERGEPAIQMERINLDLQYGNTHRVTAVSAATPEDIAKYTKQVDKAIEEWLKAEEIAKLKKHPALMDF